MRRWGSCLCRCRRRRRSLRRLAVDSTGLRASERGEQTFGHPKFQTSAKCSERAIRTVQDGVQAVATFCGLKCVLATLLAGKSDRLQQLVSSPKRKERKEYYTRCESIFARIDIYSPCTPGITYVSVAPNTRFEEQPEVGDPIDDSDGRGIFNQTQIRRRTGPSNPSSRRTERLLRIHPRATQSTDRPTS